MTLGCLCSDPNPDVKFSYHHQFGFFYSYDRQAVTPALTLRAVEASMLAKEQLSQRRSRHAPAAFTDDGFVLGLAFVTQASAWLSCWSPLRYR